DSRMSSLGSIELQNIVERHAHRLLVSDKSFLRVDIDAFARSERRQAWRVLGATELRQVVHHSRAIWSREEANHEPFVQAVSGVAEGLVRHDLEGVLTLGAELLDRKEADEVAHPFAEDGE